MKPFTVDFHTAAKAAIRQRFYMDRDMRTKVVHNAEPRLHLVPVLHPETGEHIARKNVDPWTGIVSYRNFDRVRVGTPVKTIYKNPIDPKGKFSWDPTFTPGVDSIRRDW